MSIYLFRKYWGKYKGRLFSLILSIILLVAASVFCVLNERAELRRRLHTLYNENGNYAECIMNVTDEQEIREIMEIPYIDRVGIVSVAGSFREGDCTYTVGNFENEEAENSLHLPMAQGRMPKESGEIAMPEFLINMLYPNAAIGDEITLSFEDLDGESSEGTYRLSGIISNFTNRYDMEYISFDGITISHIDYSKYPTPSVYIHKDDSSGFEKYYNYYISPSDELYFKKECGEYLNEISETVGEICGKYGSVSGGGNAYFVQVLMSGNNDEGGYAETEESGNIKVTRIISLFMVIIAGISMFSGILSVMPKRVESLKLLRFIGMSKLRLFGIFITEFFLFWLIGSAAGVLAGCSIHGLALFFQRAVGLGAYRGYIAELVVERMTMSPFIMPLLLSLLIAAAALTIPVKRIVTMSSYKKPALKGISGRARSFGRAFSKVTGARFSLLLYFISTSVVVVITLFIYCYYTQSGKGTTYFSLGSEDVSAAYYNVNGIDFKENGIDCGIYVQMDRDNMVVLDGGYGVTSDELRELEIRADCLAYGNYNTMICYDKGEEYPPQLKLLEPLDDSFKERMPDIYEFRSKINVISNVSFYLFSADMLKRLYGADPDDVVLVWDNDSFPYEVGEYVPAKNMLCDSYSVPMLDTTKRYNIKITKRFNCGELDEKIPGIPEGLAKYRQIVMTAETAEEIGFYYPEYKNVLMKFREKTSRKEMEEFISSVLKKHARTITIQELERKARLKRLSSNANSIMLFVLLFILNTISLWNLLRVNAGNNVEKFQIMHSLGIPWKRIRTMFIGNVVKAMAAALILCTIFSIGAQRLMSEKYEEYWSLLGQQQEIIGNTEFPEIIDTIELSHITGEYPNLLPAYDVTAKMEHLEKTYMLKKELWLPSLTVPLLVIWAAVIISTMFCALTAAGKIKDERMQTKE